VVIAIEVNHDILGILLDLVTCHESEQPRNMTEWSLHDEKHGACTGTSAGAGMEQCSSNTTWTMVYPSYNACLTYGGERKPR
jgi:hypothetical protein